MKIVVISSTVFPVPVIGYSGLEHLAWLHAKCFAERGHEVVLVAPDGSSCPGVGVLHTGPAGQHDEFHAYEKYWQELTRADVVVDHTWQKNSLRLKGEGVLRAPVLCVCHAPINTMFQALPEVEKPCFVCISEDQKNHFEALFAPAKARVAYNGVDTDFYKPLDIERKDRFLFLARFSTIKGPDLAIRACRDAGASLDLIGDTSITQEPDFLNYCLSLCDDDQIRFVGPKNRGECVWWLSRAKGLLHPNERFREPFGLAPVEAQLCGCPVIAWDNGAMRETIQVPTTGTLVTNYDDLVSAVGTFDSQPFDRKECVRWASRYSVDSMISRYEDLMVEAVDTGGW